MRKLHRSTAPSHSLKPPAKTCVAKLADIYKAIEHWCSCVGEQLQSVEDAGVMHAVEQQAWAGGATQMVLLLNLLLLLCSNLHAADQTMLMVECCCWCGW
jgi:hypothetical protein